MNYQTINYDMATYLVSELDEVWKLNISTRNILDVTADRRAAVLSAIGRDLPVPDFGSSWTSQMTEFLSEQTANYCVRNAEQICDSWGDDSKALRLFGFFEALPFDFTADQTAAIREAIIHWGCLDMSC